MSRSRNAGSHVPLLPDFRREAERRGLLDAGAPLDVQTAFALVRDMPWVANADTLPEVTLVERRGHDASKHYLLRQLLYELGHPSILVACAHTWSIESAEWATGEARAILEAGPVADVHTFLRVDSDEGWSTVDATWPLATSHLGLPANERFVPGREMRVAADPEELYHVPDDADPEEFRRRLLDAHLDERGPRARERRNAFRAALGSWLAAELR
jgi:hypothetical protein